MSRDYYSVLNANENHPGVFRAYADSHVAYDSLGFGNDILIDCFFLCQCDGGWRAYMCYRCRDVPANRVTLDSTNFFDWLGINN